MNAANIVAVLVVACILCELPMCDAGCHGPPGTRRRNITRCNDHSDCTKEDEACLRGKCKPCDCRLKTQCFLNKANKADCDCSNDTKHTGDHCECLLSTTPTTAAPTTAAPTTAAPTTPTTAPTTSPPCETGWTFCDGSCYYFSMVGDYETWSDSLTVCDILGGRLASVENAATHNCISQELDATGDDQEVYWIGGQRTSSSGVFVWLDGSLFPSPGYWAPGKPGSTVGCMFYYTVSGSWGWGAYDTMSCSPGHYETTGHYICEKDV